jgi:hypothetical protein
VIPIDREHRRSEATLAFVILDKVFTIVKENNVGKGDSIIISAFLGGCRGAAYLVNH